jgi:hypothetical protein
VGEQVVWAAVVRHVAGRDGAHVRAHRVELRRELAVRRRRRDEDAVRPLVPRQVESPITVEVGDRRLGIDAEAALRGGEAAAGLSDEDRDTESAARDDDVAPAVAVEVGDLRAVEHVEDRRRTEHDRVAGDLNDQPSRRIQAGDDHVLAPVAIDVGDGRNRSGAGRDRRRGLEGGRHGLRRRGESGRRGDHRHPCPSTLHAVARLSRAGERRQEVFTDRSRACAQAAVMALTQVRVFRLIV